MSTGTITKRTLKSGHSYVLKYDAAPDPETKDRDTRYETLRNVTKKEAQKRLRELLSEVDNNTDVAPNKITVEQWLRQWLKDFAPRKCKAKSTLERYEQFIEKHIVPEIGSLKLQKLRTEHLEKLYSRKLANGRLNASGGLSARTVHHLHRCLSTALKKAVKLGKIQKNPCDDTDDISPDKAKIEWLTDAETAVMMEAAKASKSPTLFPLVTLAVTTGMRRGEMCGLKWSDVDLDAGSLKVVSTLEDTKEGLRLKDPKTDSSKRTINLPAMTVDALRSHKAKQNALRLRLGAGQGDYVFEAFKDDAFGPMRPRAVTKMFGSFIAGVDVTRITLHGLRHTAATSAIGAGENIAAVSKRLGHANTSITLDTYTHAAPSDDVDIAANLNKRLAGYFKSN